MVQKKKKKNYYILLPAALILHLSPDASNAASDLRSVSVHGGKHMKGRNRGEDE